MPEDIPAQSSPTPEPTPEPESTPVIDLGPGPGINIGEEFGTAKRNLPPAKIVAIVLGIAAVLLGIFAFVSRAKPQGNGSVDNIAGVCTYSPGGGLENFRGSSARRNQAPLRQCRLIDGIQVDRGRTTIALETPSDEPRCPPVPEREMRQ